MPNPPKPRRFQQDRMTVLVPFAAVTADTGPSPAFFLLEDADIENVKICVPAGLAADASNFFEIALKAGATTIATWSTATAAQGALAANTFHDMVRPVTRVAAGKIDILLDETGTASLPAGFLQVTFKYRG